ncbi:MAG TPA: hypothetical protein VKL21_06065 [Candidatus Methanoperedens sp.]|nr:hypothetical protein [Candidatus Methanoperedens sp.]
MRCQKNSSKRSYSDLVELKTVVMELVLNEKYVILWNHIKQYHVNITETEILNGLYYGLFKPDKNIESRFVSWSKFTISKRLIRIVFEVHEASDNDFVLVITAFDE